MGRGQRRLLRRGGAPPLSSHDFVLSSPTSTSSSPLPLPLNPIDSSCWHPTITRTPRPQLLIKPSSPRAHAQRDRSISLLATQQFQVFFLLVSGSFSGGFDLRRCPLAAGFCVSVVRKLSHTLALNLRFYVSAGRSLRRSWSSADLVFPPYRADCWIDTLFPAFRCLIWPKLSPLPDTM